VTGSVKITLNTLQTHTLTRRIVIVVVMTGVVIDSDITEDVQTHETTVATTRQTSTDLATT